MSITVLIKRATVEQLRNQLQINLDAIKELEKQFVDRNNIVNDIQAELDNRTLAAYWEAHPELTSVAVGDKILTTEAARQYGLCDSLGSINTVKEFKIYRGECGAMVHLDESWGEVFKSFEVISGMRRAYLEQQPETKE